MLKNELGRRVTRMTGMGGSTLEVHPSLENWAKRLADHTVQFGAEVERAIMKHRKEIINEQLVCKNIAGALAAALPLSVQAPAAALAAVALRNSPAPAHGRHCH